MKRHHALALAMLASATTVCAQTLPHPGACKADVVKLCPEATAALDRNAQQACLIQKMAQLSPDCRANMQVIKQAHAAAKSGSPETTK